VGSRIPFVYIRDGKRARAEKAYNFSEDPLYALEKGLTIDADYYVKNCLLKPVARLLEPLVRDVEHELTSGDHVRSVVKPSAATAAGALGKFVNIGHRCPGCRAALRGGDAAVCPSCEPRHAELYMEKLAEAEAARAEFTALWVGCQKCKKTVAVEILCDDVECGAFFRREKAKIDTRKTEAALARFDW
jgi:DNA polymerase delta subunit 1